MRSPEPRTKPRSQRRPSSRHPCAPSRHPCAPSVIPAQAGTNPPQHPIVPQFIPPPFQESPAKCPISADPPIRPYLVDTRVYAPDSPFCRRPLPGGRLGGGCKAPSRAPSPARSADPPPATPAPLPVIPAPFPSFLRRQEPTHPNTQSFPNSSLSPDQRGGAPIHPSPLPGGRLGGGCEAPSRAPSPARSTDPPPATPARPPATLTPSRHPCASSVIPAQAGTTGGRTDPSGAPTPAPPPRRSQSACPH